MEIEVTREGADMVVRPHGEIDVQTAPALRHAMDQAVESGSGDLVVDLEGVGFIDSSGLGVLLGRFRRMPAGRAMALRRPRSHVLGLLRLAGLPGLMRVEEGPTSGGAGEHAGRGV